MTRPFAPALSFTQADGHERVFANTDDLQAFVEREQSFWSFLEQKPGSGQSTLAHNARWPVDRLRVLQSTLREYENGENNEGQVRDQLAQTYSHVRHKIPTSEEPNAIALQGMASELSDEAFFAAATFLLSRFDDSIGAPRPNQADVWLGIVAASNYKLGYSPAKTQAVGVALDNMLAKYADKLVTEDVKLANRHAELNAARERFEKLAAEQVNTANNDEDVARGRRESAAVKLIQDKTLELMAVKERLDALQQTFLEKLHLEAPTEYWTKKRERHKQFAMWWGVAAGLWGIAATGTMLLGLQVELDAIGQLTSEAPIAVYVVHATRGLLLSVVAFWVARILVRLCLSELHLGMDAYERTTMVLTYLALSTEGKVDEKERTLVLAALFRPTADGLVKDDASMDGNIAAILGQLKGK